MNVTEALATRYSVRAFRPGPVDRETVRKIMEAAIRSPSWADTQPWEVFVAAGQALERLRTAYLARFDQGAPPAPELPAPKEWPDALKRHTGEMMAARLAAMGIRRDDPDARRALSRRNFEFFGAPVVAFLCMDRSLTPWSVFDMGVFAQSIMLAAQEYGVGSIPAAMFVTYPDLVRAELGIPDNLLILIGIALGYEDASNPANRVRSPRRPLDEVVRFKGW